MLTINSIHWKHTSVASGKMLFVSALRLRAGQIILERTNELVLVLGYGTMSSVLISDVLASLQCVRSKS